MYLTWLKKSMKSKNWSTFYSKKSNRYFSISVLNHFSNSKMNNLSWSGHNWLKTSKRKSTIFCLNLRKIKMFPGSSIKVDYWIRLYELYLTFVKDCLKKANHQLILISISMKHTILLNKARKIKSNYKNRESWVLRKEWFLKIIIDFFQYLQD